MLAGQRSTYLWIGPAAVAVIVVAIVELHTQNGVLSHGGRTGASYSRSPR